MLIKLTPGERKKKIKKETEKLLSGTKQVERNQRCWKFNFEVCCVWEREREKKNS